MIICQISFLELISQADSSNWTLCMTPVTKTHIFEKFYLLLKEKDTFILNILRNNIKNIFNKDFIVNRNLS